MIPCRLIPLPSVGGQQIPGKLFAHELVVRQILVERIDHVIAISPGVGITVVLVVAGRVRIARDVKPVASPLLAVSRRGEQPVHNLCKRIGRRVREQTRASPARLAEAPSGRT